MITKNDILNYTKQPITEKDLKSKLYNGSYSVRHIQRFESTIAALIKKDLLVRVVINNEIFYEASSPVNNTTSD